MVASTQITNTETYAFIAALVFKLLSRKVLFIKRKKIETDKKKTANFTSKLLRNYKYLICKIYRIHLKHISVYLSVLFTIRMTVPSSLK